MVSIGNADGQSILSPSSEKWNIADGFTKIKILRILIELDLQETIAKFGRKDLEEYLPPEMVASRRVEGLERMVFCLRQLIGNCKFSIDSKDKLRVNDLISRIEQVEAVLDGISRIIVNDVTKEEMLIINEGHFKKCFEILRHIKDELNVPLNKAGLIFRKSDDIDLDSLMRNIMEGN